MSVLISHSGLWKRITENLKEYDQYQPIQDAPSFIQSHEVDARIVVTDDGRLYDTTMSKLLEVESDSHFKTVVFSNIVTYEVISGARTNLFYALKNNGNLYSGFIDSDSKVNEWSLVRSNVDHLMRSRRSNIVSISESTLCYHDHGGQDTFVNLPNDDEIIEVQYGLVITRDWIFIIDIHNMAIDSIERQGRLIGCGIVNVHQSRPICNIIEVAIVEEVTSEGGDDQLLIRYRTINRGEAVVECDREVYNRDLDECHQRSPWINVISIQNHAHLVNRDGVVVKLLSEGGTVSTNIPRCIFNLNHHSKNPLSRI